MVDRVTQEVLGLHRLFQEWYRGALDSLELDQHIASRLSSSFSIVFPDGKEWKKDLFLDQLRPESGSDSSFRIEILDLVVIPLSSSIVLAMYKEYQYWGFEDEPNVRLNSTAVLEVGEQSIEWVRIHETHIGV